MVAFVVDSADDGVGEFFPALPLMRGGAGLFHCQHTIEQKHALFCPAFQKAVTHRANAEIGLQFLVDIDERRRNAHAGLDGKAQPMRLAKPVIGILA
ncbi:hypothetical protein D3C78_1301980 [compost metagenome]